MPKITAILVSDIPVYAGLAGFITWSIIDRAFSLRRQQQRQGAYQDRSSYWLISLSWYAAMIYSMLDSFWLEWTILPGPWRAAQWVGIPLVVVGLCIRIQARRALGVQYRVKVQTSDAHQLVTSGIYQRIRHPAYLGLLCLMIGLPLCLGSMAGLLIAIASGILAILYRIRVEEQALQAWFGDTYAAYVGRTQRLIPGLW